MINIEITIKRDGRSITYPSCREMMEARIAYWFAFSFRKYEKLVQLSQTVEQTEDILATVYDLPIGSLYGSHLLFGSIPTLTESIAKPEVREKLLNPENYYSIEINSITRVVKVWCKGRGDPLPKYVKKYKLRHSLYNIASEEEVNRQQVTRL